MIAKDIVKIIEKIAPSYLTEKWDNSGLQLGSLNKKVNKVMIAMDITPNVVDKAKNMNIDMIVTHHPLIFKPLKNISKDDNVGKMLYDLINGDIVVYSAHSNMDGSMVNTSEIFARYLNLQNIKALDTTTNQKLYKIAVFVPKTHEDVVRSAMTKAGAGHIGNYSHCSFNTEGIGTFMPREGSNPFIGDKNILEKVKEVKIETIVGQGNLEDVIEKMIKSHPYEEVAYDIYPTINNIKNGYGRIGNLEDTVTLKDLAEEIKGKLRIDTIRVYGNLDRVVKNIALCSGSGMDFIMDAFKRGADVFVTGDIKYHDYQLAKNLGIALIDANHYDTEKTMLYYLQDYFKEALDKDVVIDLYDNNDYKFITL